MRYVKTIRYEDINYQLSHQEDQEAIMKGWREFINYFDSTVYIQFSFFNLTVPQEVFEKRIVIPPQNDSFDSIREEYTEMLETQLAKGNNGLERTKFLTFGIEAKNLKSAKPRLERIESELMGNFKRLGVEATPLDGKALLTLMHRVFHMDTMEPFYFDWDWLVPSGLSTKDFIAPSSFEFRDGRMFKIGNTFCSALYLHIGAEKLDDRSLKKYLDLDSNLLVSIHLKAVDQAEAIKMVKRAVTELDRTKIEEQKKAVRSGYDMDILPSDLAAYGPDTKNLLEMLQSQNEQLYLATILMICTGETKQELKNNIAEAKRRAQTMSCALTSLDFQQEQAMVSCLPLGLNQINIQRGMPTSSLAIFVPFTTRELFQQSSEALYYGLNAVSSNMIMVDRKRLNNPNGIVLGTPGSGKSFSAKREMTNVYLMTRDDIVICDPEAEYAPLVTRLGGQIIRISPNSTDYINPMDINMDYNDGSDPLRLKSSFVLSMCELIVGGAEKLEAKARSAVDRCLPVVYKAYFRDPVPENMPVLGDLYELLMQQEEPEARDVAAALEIYVSGSLNVFNHRTNVNVTNRVMCYDIKELGSQLKRIGMLLVQDQIWNRITANRAAKRATWYYVDEMHLLLRDAQTAAYMVEIWKRARKWGGVPTGITQNVKDLLSSREVENILENSDFVYMLNQASGDREILARHLGISDHQLSYVKQSGPGEGLLFYGSTIIPFVDRFPQNTELYKLMTTKLTETGKETEK